MRFFKLNIVIFLAALTLTGVAHADEKAKALGQIEAAKAAIEAFTKKNYDNKLVTADIEAARSAVKSGEETFLKGRTMMGLGDLTPEAGREVKHFTDLVELNLTLGQTRIDRAKASDELKPLSSQVAKLRAKAKMFEDRKAELERLRAGLAKHEATVKELEEVKAENARLIEKEKKQAAEAKGLTEELAGLKAELAKRPLPPPVVPAVAPAAATPPSSPAAGPGAATPPLPRPTQVATPVAEAPLAVKP